MTRHTRAYSFLFGFLIAAAGALLSADARAQSHRIVPVEHPAYRYIDRLQHRGHLLRLSPTALPYTRGEIRRALRDLRELGKRDRDDLSRRERRWVKQLRGVMNPFGDAEKHFDSFPREGGDEQFDSFRREGKDKHFDSFRRDDDNTIIGGALTAGGTAATTERLDLMRPTGGGALYPRAGGLLFLQKGVVIAEAGLQYDRYYSLDPDGLDAARRLAVRSENSYLGIRTRPVSVYLGRYSHHWGASDMPALLISKNPRSIDHLSFRLGYGQLALRSVVGELDNIGADDVFTGSDFEPGSKRRYLSAHRLDWRPSRHVALTLMESALYSGTQAGPSLKFLNPLHSLTFVVANKPQNTEHNGFVGAGFWAYARPLTFYGQLLIDDLDIVNRIEPASLAATASVTYGGVTSGLDLSADVTLATARVYNSPQTEGIYTYLLRGIGLHFSDYIRASLRGDLYFDQLATGLSLQPKIEVLWQGEADLRDPYPPSTPPPSDPTGEAGVDTILDGVTERTIRPALELFYQPLPWVWVRADGGVNLIHNENHVSGASDTRFEGLVELGLRWNLTRAIDLRW